MTPDPRSEGPLGCGEGRVGREMYVSVFAAAGFMVTALREFGNRPIPWLLVARLEIVSRPIETERG